MIGITDNKKTLGEEPVCCQATREMTLVEQLEQQKSNLIEHLGHIEEAIKALKRDPNLESKFNLIRRVR